MSLDVHLTLKGVQNLPTGPKIFIREDGQTKEISRDEWDVRFPGREPVTVELNNDDAEVYWGNITHNLNEMAEAAGLYKPLWYPDELGFTKAAQLIEPLRDGLAKLQTEPDVYRALNPSNGWGDYDGFLRFVREYLTACLTYPDADIHVSI